jgi:DNA-binding transcriptional regulator YiaG
MIQSSPTPELIRETRAKAGLSASKAASLIYRSLRNWQQWELGERKMCPALFELFCLKVKNDE